MNRRVIAVYAICSLGICASAVAKWTFENVNLQDVIRSSHIIAIASIGGDRFELDDKRRTCRLDIKEVLKGEIALGEIDIGFEHFPTIREMPLPQRLKSRADILVFAEKCAGGYVWRSIGFSGTKEQAENKEFIINSFLNEGTIRIVPDVVTLSSFKAELKSRP